MYTVYITTGPGDGTDLEPKQFDTIEAAMFYLLSTAGVYPEIDAYGGVDGYDLTTAVRVSGLIKRNNQTIFETQTYPEN